MKLVTIFKSKFFYIGLFILIFSITLTSINSSYLAANSEKFPVMRDLILDNITYLKVAWIYDILALTSTLLFVLYIFVKEPEKIPYALLLFGFLYILRAIFIVLTPLHAPASDNNPILVGATFTAGLYFSGHVGETFLAFLLSKGKFKIAFSFLLIMIIFFLLVARGHYSIDIFSALIFAYAIFCFGEKYLKKHFSIKKE